MASGKEGAMSCTLKRSSGSVIFVKGKLIKAIMFVMSLFVAQSYLCPSAYSLLGEKKWGQDVRASTQESSQCVPKILSDGFGNFIVAFTDDRNGDVNIYVQKFDTSGQRMWQHAGVGNGQGPNPYGYLVWDVTPDGSGGVFIAWHASVTSSRANADIYIQRIRSDGSQQWSTPGLVVCSASGGQTHPALVPDGSGGVYIFWKDERRNNTAGGFQIDLYGQHITQSGQLLWETDGRLITLGASPQGFSEWEPAVTALVDDHGGILIGWWNSQTKKPRVQRIDLDGNTLWNQEITDSREYDDQDIAPRMCNSDTGVIVQYKKRVSGADRLWLTKRSYTSGAAEWSYEITGVRYWPLSQQIYPDGNNGCFVSGVSTASPYRVVGQRISSSGAFLWNGGQPVIVSNYVPFQSVAAPDNQNGLFAFWMQNSETGSPGLYAQRLSSTGALLWDNPLLISNPYLISCGTGMTLDMIRDGYNGAIISWAQSSSPRVYAQRIADMSSDSTLPSIEITSPTTYSTYSTDNQTISVAGNASDNIGVTRITWVNDRGGSGTASGTTTWSAGGIQLLSGQNVITVLAYDAAGNQATDTLTVTYNPTQILFVTNTSSVSVPEGGTATFQLRLNAPPTTSVNAMVSWYSGDPDISVQSGSSLTFTSENWDRYQTVTLRAAEDSDMINGVANILITASWLPDVYVIAREIDDDSKNPVLLIHGICGNPAGTWGYMDNLLIEDDFNVYYFNYSFEAAQNWPVAALAQHLSTQVNDILQETGATQIDVVAHSMGGLIVRAWMADITTLFGVQYTDQIRRLIMIGTPNHGSVWANAGAFPGEWGCFSDNQLIDMRLGSNFMWNLNYNWSQINWGAKLQNMLTVAGTTNCLSDIDADNDCFVNVSSVGLKGIEQRYVPYAHTKQVNLENMDRNHMTYKIVQEFLRNGRILNQSEIGYMPPNFTQGWLLVKVHSSGVSIPLTINPLTWTPVPSHPNDYELNGIQGIMTATSIDALASDYQVRISITGYSDKTESVRIESAKTVLLSVTLQHTPSPSPNNDNGGGSGGGCFIATAAFGCEMEPHVKILRDFRDRVLLLAPMGKAFVSFYYNISPPIADFISDHDVLKTIVRWGLIPIVGLCWISMSLGPQLTFLLMAIISIMLLSCLVAVYRRRSRTV
jgi:triacylglycerol esterase/lipase EstA (alpha/beta hydrolase family)